MEGQVYGDYRLVRRLGRGGMGEVWLGRHVKTTGAAAVKILRDNGKPRERLIELLHRERRAVSRLRHPHIVNLFDVGPDFLVTAYVDGFDLARRLRTPIDPATAVYITLQVASALAHAHEHGVIHRDVKPSNILLDHVGNAYLTDFGLAILPDGDVDAPRAGTPGFMAPEQLAGGEIGPAADQYALGRTLLEMLAGGPVSTDHESALAQLPESLPLALKAAAARATDPDPTRRFPSVQAFADALETIDLRAYPPPVRIAPEVRVRAPFAWCGGAEGVKQMTPDIMRADYRLSTLQARGLLSRDVLRSFTDRTGYADFGWSVYGRSSRLGPLTEAASHARATDVIVLLHGFLCTREVWRNVALSVCRDNAQTLVLAPDVLGFGVSRFAASEPRPEHASPAGLVRAVADWLAILGVRDLPTVLVGHSAGGVALMSVGDGEMGLKTQRLAVTPVFPFCHGDLRLRLKAGATILRGLGRFDAMRRWFARKFVYDAPEARPYATAERERMMRIFLETPPQTLATVSMAYADAKPAPPERLRRCTVVLSQDDPLTPKPVIERALGALGLPAENVHLIHSHGHFVQGELEVNPSLTARNLNQITNLVNGLLVASREGTIQSTEVASTEISTGSAEGALAAGPATAPPTAPSTESASATDTDPQVATTVTSEPGSGLPAAAPPPPASHRRRR